MTLSRTISQTAISRAQADVVSARGSLVAETCVSKVCEREGAVFLVQGCCLLQMAPSLRSVCRAPPAHHQNESCTHFMPISMHHMLCHQ